LFTSMSMALIVGGGTLALGAASVGLGLYSGMQGAAAGAAQSRAQQAAAEAGAKAMVDSATLNSAIMEQRAEINRRAGLMQATAEIKTAQIEGRVAEIGMMQAELSGVGAQIGEQNAILGGIQAKFAASAGMANSLASSRANRIDSRLGRMNARTLTDSANLAQRTSGSRALRLRQEGEKATAIIRNRVAASGLNMEGSAIEVMSDTVANIELTAQDMAYEADLEARQYRQQATSELYGSRRSLLAAKADTRNAAIIQRNEVISRTGTEFAVATAQLEQEAAKFAGAASGYALEAAQFRQDMGVIQIDLVNDAFEVDMQDAAYEIEKAKIQGEAGLLSAISSAGQSRALQIGHWGTAMAGTADILRGASTLFGPR
jgi:hypothetical protein